MTSSALIRSLARATRDYPLDRKLLVCARRAHGFELLRALTVSGTPWLGWEIATPWQLAIDLVQDELAANNESIADEFRVMRLVDDAIDAVIAAGKGELRDAIGSASFRDALHRAVGLLRRAGKSVHAGAVDGTILQATLGVLAEYEQRLQDGGLVDRADVMRRALDVVQRGARPWPGAHLFFAPTTRFGLRGELLDALLRSGAASLLESDRVHGLVMPEALLRTVGASDASTRLAYLHAPALGENDNSISISISISNVTTAPTPTPTPTPRQFAAATPMDELREVLRWVVEQRLPWDQVEIVATDPRAYGNALYALARRLGVPLTLANGIDLARTRTGRAIRAYLAWLRDAFPAEGLRIMLETGDVATRDPPGVPGSRVAYRLRRLRIGWGKQRYYEIIERALSASFTPASPDDDREPQETERARDRERIELRALRDLVFPILQAAPEAPSRLGAGDSLHSPADIARGLLVFLEHVSAGDESDSAVRQRIRARLDRAVVELTRPTSWEAALAIVQRSVDSRVTPEDEDEVGWTSAPGRLHFSDLRSGGLTGRLHTFVVGLDAGRVAANAGVDPILTDRARRELLGLPTLRERAALRRFELAELLARLRGEVTMSFAAWDATEGRAVPPAMEMLQALRLLQGDASLSYTDLHRELGTLAGAVPSGEGRLDSGDVWLFALSSSTGILRAATPVVEEAYPHLRRGQLAQRARGEHRFNAYHGKLRRNANANRLYSASQLEALGTCPRRYLYRYLLRVDVPELIEFDPEKWLDPRERGSLLHRAYEDTLNRARERGVEYKSKEFWNIAASALREAIAITSDRLPPPGEEVYDREVRDLADDLRQFVKMIRRLAPDWRELEYKFGEGERPLVVETPLGPMRLRGAIDRIDQIDDGKLQVIDYKTGRKYGYYSKRPFNGGRRIQHVVYSMAAARLLGQEVARMEYHFPTLRGETEIVPYWPRQLEPMDHALARLLRIAAGDTFAATDDPRDCRYCDFAAVCRAKIDEFGGVESPPATWSKEIGIELEDADALRILRRVDG